MNYLMLLYYDAKYTNYNYNYNYNSLGFNETKCSMKQTVKFRTILTKQTKGQVSQIFALWMVVTLHAQGLDCRGTVGDCQILESDLFCIIGRERYHCT